MNTANAPPYRLHSVIVSFTASAEVDAWSEFAVAVGLCEVAFPTHDWEVDVSALPPDPRETKKYLHVYGHSHDEQGSLSHWTLRLRPRPGAEPPSDVKRGSARVGGYPRILETFARNWPAERQVSAEVSAFFRLDNRWKPAVGGCGLPQACSMAGISLQPKSLEWRLEPPSIGVHKILLEAGSAVDSMLVGTGRFPLKLAAEIMTVGENFVWAGVEPLLERVSET